MASAHCNRHANNTCQQKCQGSSSSGQKVSSLFKGSENGQKSKPVYQAQTPQAQANSCPNQGMCKASGHHHNLHTHSHGHGCSHNKHQVTGGTSCHCTNKTNGRHGHFHGHNHATNGSVSCVGKPRDRNLFRRIKNRISGNGNCNDGSSSSSDGESDNECCHKIKN